MAAKRTWTPAQLDAMNTRNKTLLVSAAAGSGKTATLTQRIINSLTDKNNPSSIDKMLVVTYTRAAAAELRARISAALSEAIVNDPTNKLLNSQLIKLPSAQICTIDSFYIDAIRSNFSTLGITPNFRIADPAEDILLATSVMADTVDKFYDTEPMFPRLVECFGNARSFDSINDIFISISERCASLPEGIKFLKDYSYELSNDADKDFFATKLGKIIRNRSVDFITHVIKGLSEAVEYFAQNQDYAKYYLSPFQELLGFCEKLHSLLLKPDGGYSDSRDLLLSYSLPNLPRGKKGFEETEEILFFKNFRKKMSDNIKTLLDHSFMTPPSSISRAMKETAEYTMLIYRLLEEFERCMDEEKKRRNYLTFTDTKRYALKLLVNEDGTPTPTAIAFSERYSDIYIDEYQDVDSLQDLIFKSISKPNNRFMVGDIKQSIYAFRGSEPDLFSEYRAKFPDLHSKEAENSNSASIFMSSNFRCDKNIIDFTNAVCSYLFSVSQKSLGYTQKDDLEWKKPLENENYVSPKVCVDVIIPPKAPTATQIKNGAEPIDKSLVLTKDEYESEFIANEIKRLIDTEKLADGKSIRPCDIAIILRKKRYMKTITAALAKVGIKTTDSEKDRYLSDPDVMMMVCLLNAVDNPHRDYYLAGALRSPVFGFSLEDLIIIRKADSYSHSLYDALTVYSKTDDELAERCRSFLTYLEAWRDSAVSTPADRLMREILDSPPMIASGLEALKTANGEAGNLLLLYEYARKFENGSFKGLSSFIDFINSMLDEGKKISSPEKPQGEDEVALITAHHSKGLEFPVCFLFGCGKAITDPTAGDSLVFDRHVGMAMKLSDTTGFAAVNTPLRNAIFAQKMDYELEEEMRILYVTMTRARERLYITASVASTEEKLMEKAAACVRIQSRYALLSCSSYLQWILASLQANDAKDAYELRFHNLTVSSNNSVSQEENPDFIDFTTDEKIEQEPDSELLSLLTEKFSFEYPYRNLKRIPSKLSVSRLSPDALDQNDTATELTKTIAEKKAAIPDFFAPQLSGARKAAEKGTATHLFLQFFNLHNAKRNGICEEFSRLCTLGYLPDNAEDLIRFDELEAFMSSELFDIVISAKKIIREQRFNLLLSAEEFSKDNNFKKLIADETLAVQGVIDLIVIDSDGNLSLYDYKTDRLTKEELADASLAHKKMNSLHAMQLSYYKRAVELLFERECKRVAVYSTHAAKLFDIDILPLDLPNL